MNIEKFNETKLKLIKEDIIKELKILNVNKKDKNLLLNLIILFDLLTENKNETFVNLLINLINACDINKKEELLIRLNSLRTQLDQENFIEIRKFPCFIFYFKKENITIYLNKLPLDWEVLLIEIRKIEFNEMNVNVYKNINKNDKLFSMKLNNKNFENNLIEILENNIFLNIRITLLKKKDYI
jgi:hypothetical protein